MDIVVDDYENIGVILEHKSNDKFKVRWFNEDRLTDHEVLEFKDIRKKTLFAKN